jgi:transposase
VPDLLCDGFFPAPKRRRDGRGRPWASNRECVEGILWVLRTGARWRDLPPEYPSGPTCWRRLRQWEEQGVWLQAWRALLAALHHEQLLDWDETFLDGSFVWAKKGALELAKPSGARARSGWYWSMARAFSTGSATGERFASRGHAGGKHARASKGPLLGTGTAAQPTAAGHRGSGL